MRTLQINLIRKNLVSILGVATACFVGTLAVQAVESPREPGQEAGERVVVKVDDLDVAFRWCPPGTFMMGSPVTEPGRLSAGWERLHQVTFTSGFWMSETEVTQALYTKIMGGNPSYCRGDTHPVETVGMPKAADFCNRLSERTGLSVRLPSEAQWEYAARAGSTTVYTWGDECGEGTMQYRALGLHPMERQMPGTVPVASFAPNAWGLYDVHGNVAEWVADRFDPTYYATSPESDPPGPDVGTNRVLRGGSWASIAECCRCASRNADVEPYGSPTYGFRMIVCPAPASK